MDLGVREPVAAGGAGGVLSQPLPDASIAEDMGAGERHDLAALWENLHADGAVFAGVVWAHLALFTKHCL